MCESFMVCLVFAFLLSWTSLLGFTSYWLLTCVRSHSSSEFEFRRLQLHYSTLRSWYAGCAHSCRGCAVWRLLTNTNEPFWAHYDELALGSTIRRIKQLQWASSSEMLKEFLCIHYSACGGSECPARCNWSQFATIHRLHSSSPGPCSYSDQLSRLSPDPAACRDQAEGAS